jgi:threonyl-tRNA synthetase
LVLTIIAPSPTTSFPAPNVASGSFVADVDLGLGHSWSPSREELMVFSAQMHRLAEQRLPFERLSVGLGLALEMFAENPHKSGQIPSIAGAAGPGGKDAGKVTLYRVGDHVDISGGPMVADTSFLGRRCTVPVAHKIVQAGVQLYRFQGVALPKEIYLNHFAYSVLEKRASRLNQGGLETTRPAQPV